MEWLKNFFGLSDCEQIIALLCTAVTGLAGAVAYLYRAQVKQNESHAEDLRDALEVSGRGNRAMLSMLDRDSRRPR